MSKHATPINHYHVIGDQTTYYVQPEDLVKPQEYFWNDQTQYYSHQEDIVGEEEFQYVYPDNCTQGINSLLTDNDCNSESPPIPPKMTEKYGIRNVWATDDWETEVLNMGEVAKTHKYVALVCVSLKLKKLYYTSRLGPLRQKRAQ